MNGSHIPYNSEVTGDKCHKPPCARCGAPSRWAVCYSRTKVLFCCATCAEDKVKSLRKVAHAHNLSLRTKKYEQKKVNGVPRWQTSFEVPESLLRAATYDGVIELSCPECKDTRRVEPDCESYTCDCGREVSNPLVRCGYI